MNERINRFERLWRKPDIPSPPALVRQTNEHHRLPPDLLEEWWLATIEEKEAILACLTPIRFEID